jgi:hypothetical protein
MEPRPGLGRLGGKPVQTSRSSLMASQRPAPDFYLASPEHEGDWARARAAWITRALHSTSGQQLFLIHIDPPIIGQAYGLVEIDIHEVVLGARFGPFPLQNISAQPVHVAVYLIPPSVGISSGLVSLDDLKLEAWADLTRTCPKP